MLLHANSNKNITYKHSQSLIASLHRHHAQFPQPTHLTSSYRPILHPQHKSNKTIWRARKEKNTQVGETKKAYKRVK